MPMHEELYRAFYDYIVDKLGYKLEPEEAEEMAEELVQVVRREFNEELRW